MDASKEFTYEQLEEEIKTAWEIESDSIDYLYNLAIQNETVLSRKYSLESSINLSNHDENFIHMLIKYGTLNVIIGVLKKLDELDKAQLNSEVKVVNQRPTLVSLLNQENKVGWIPMYYVFSHWSLELLELLHSIDKNQIRHTSYNGSVLIKSWEFGGGKQDGTSLKWIRYLLETWKLKINETDKSGCTAIYMACFKNNYELVKYLLENGADPSKLCTNESTPLHICCERGFIDVLKLLWTMRQDLIYFKDADGQTPLHIACLWSYMDIVQYLYELGGQKLLEIKNNEGLNAHEFAYEENQFEPYEFLWEKQGIKTSTFCNIL